VSNKISQGENRAAYVQDMFTRIARRYDLMNRLMTAGQDRAWREEVVRKVHLPSGGYLLDLGAGTGDLVLESQRQYANSHSFAADFTVEMMRVGQARVASQTQMPINWCAADALNLPYPNDSFDAVISGFLMRNVINRSQALDEQYRVLKPGSRIVILDTTRPSQNILTPFIYLHLNFIIPTLGQLITGSRDAYTYLPNTTRQFLTAEALASLMKQTGFKEIGFQRRMFGTVAIHWGRK